MSDAQIAACLTLGAFAAGTLGPWLVGLHACIILMWVCVGVGWALAAACFALEVFVRLDAERRTRVIFEQEMARMRRFEAGPVDCSGVSNNGQ